MGAATAPAAPADGTRDTSSRLSYVPRDARLMALILQSMGIQDVQPPALMMMLEFAHRYVYEVLQDALVYADHANSSKSAAGVSNLSVDDIQLAIQSRVNHSFTSPPSKDMLLALSSSLNSVPLPPISDKYGVKLPPVQHCLTNVNFSIVPNPPPDDMSDEDAQGDEEDEEEKGEIGDQKQERLAGRKDEGNGYEDEGDLTRQDEEMADASNAEQASAQRGTKRSLDEDEDYD